MATSMASTSIFCSCSKHLWVGFTMRLVSRTQALVDMPAEHTSHEADTYVDYAVILGDFCRPSGCP